MFGIFAEHRDAPMVSRVPGERHATTGSFDRMTRSAARLIVGA
ncbi:hypothetical protein [Rugosimonospora acidiphila]